MVSTFIECFGACGRQTHHAEMRLNFNMPLRATGAGSQRCAKDATLKFVASRA